MSDIRNSLRRDHARIAAKCVELWGNASRRPQDLTERELAYELLLHTGKEYRYSGDPTGWKLLRSLPYEERERLVGGALQYIGSLGIAKNAANVAQAVFQDLGAPELFEEFVYERDQLDVVEFTANLVAADVVLRSEAVDTAFDAASDTICGLDDVLEEYETLTAASADTVLFLLDCSVAGPKSPAHWWAERLKLLQTRAFAANPLFEAMCEAIRDKKSKAVRILEERLVDLTVAFQRQFRQEAMQAIAASSDESGERVLWDSKQELRPLRMVVYLERNGDLRFDVTSTEDNDENQTCEVVVEEQKLPTVTFRRDPETGELFGEARIPRDELRELDLSKLTFRLKRL